jgi:hypothetical protein
MTITPRLRALVALLSGALFGIGLGISGMTRPTKVLAFLDVAGAWDPSLAFVMMGAVGVSAVAVAIAKRRSAPIASARFHWAKETLIDAPLLTGAALFGVGWGLGGFCPGPALAAAASGNVAAIAFVAAMIAGMVARHATQRQDLAARRG